MEVVSESKRAAHYPFFDKIPCHNIDDSELHAFRKLAKLYAGLSVGQIENMVKNKSLIEIYYDK